MLIGITFPPICLCYWLEVSYSTSYSGQAESPCPYSKGGSYKRAGTPGGRDHGDHLKACLPQSCGKQRDTFLES